MDTKERIIVLLEHLRENSDEGKAVSAADIRAMFRERGESVAAPTLRDDIASLIRAGYDIDINEVNGVGTYYKYLDREWTEPELQILIDAISASQFITKEKSDMMIRKLRKMGGPTEREHLEPSIRTAQQVKAPNEQILYIVQTIKTAMERRSRIRFRHFMYSPELRRVPKHDGYVYEVSPYAMIWKRDRYYLVGWSEKHGGIASFRIDRMEMPEISTEAMHPVPPDFHPEDHSDRIFSMFDGPEETVTLRFSPDVMNHVVDQFGTNLTIVDRREKSIDISVRVHLSPTFYGWLFQYAGEMTIAGPEHVRLEYLERLRRSICDAEKIDPDGDKERAQKVTLRCGPEMAGCIRERFGGEIKPDGSGEGFDAIVNVPVNKAFFAWLFQNDGKVCIKSPPGIKKKYREAMYSALCDTADDRFSDDGTE